MTAEARDGQKDALLMVANYAPDVGYAWWLMENFWVEFADVASQLGIDPILIYPEPGEIPPRIREASIETIIQRFPGRTFSERMSLLRLLRSRRVRYIYLTTRGFFDPFYALCRAAGVRVIIDHDHAPGDRPPVTGFKGALKAILNRQRALTCDLHLCVSPLIQERAVSNIRIPASRTKVVQNGILPLECQEPGYAQRVLEVKGARRICVTVCRAHEYKRVVFMLHVAREYTQALARSDIMFVHCGDGPELENLVWQRDDWGLRDHVVFAGRRSDIHNILCSSHFAIHPARGEGLSLAILEYMSAGLVVHVPDIPSVSQTIRHGETGVIYRDGDAAQVAHSLATLSDDAGTRERLGRAASAEVTRHYSLASMNESFRATVAPLLKSR